MKIFLKLKSSKGAFLSLIVYPVLILFGGFIILTFLSAIAESNHVTIHFNSIQAQY